MKFGAALTALSLMAALLGMLPAAHALDSLSGMQEAYSGLGLQSSAVRDLGLIADEVSPDGANTSSPAAPVMDSEPAPPRFDPTAPDSCLVSACERVASGTDITLRRNGRQSAQAIPLPALSTLRAGLLSKLGITTVERAQCTPASVRDPKRRQAFSLYLAGFEETFHADVCGLTADTMRNEPALLSRLATALGRVADDHREALSCGRNSKAVPPSPALTSLRQFLAVTQKLEATRIELERVSQSLTAQAKACNGIMELMAPYALSRDRRAQKDIPSWVIERINRDYRACAEQSGFERYSVLTDDLVTLQNRLFNQGAPAGPLEAFSRQCGTADAFEYARSSFQKLGQRLREVGTQVTSLAQDPTGGKGNACGTNSTGPLGTILQVQCAGEYFFNEYEAQRYAQTAVSNIRIGTNRCTDGYMEFRRQFLKAGSVLDVGQFIYRTVELLYYGCPKPAEYYRDGLVDALRAYDDGPCALANAGEAVRYSKKDLDPWLKAGDPGALDRATADKGIALANQYCSNLIQVATQMERMLKHEAKVGRITEIVGFAAVGPGGWIRGAAGLGFKGAMAAGARALLRVGLAGGIGYLTGSAVGLTWELTRQTFTPGKYDLRAALAKAEAAGAYSAKVGIAVALIPRSASLIARLDAAPALVSWLGSGAVGGLTDLGSQMVDNLADTCGPTPWFVEDKKSCSVWGRNGVNWEEVAVTFVTSMVLHKASTQVTERIATSFKVNLTDPRIRAQFRDHRVRRWFLKPVPEGAVAPAPQSGRPLARLSRFADRRIDRATLFGAKKIYGEDLIPTVGVRTVLHMIGFNAAIWAGYKLKSSSNQSEVKGFTEELADGTEEMEKLDLRFQSILAQVAKGKMTEEAAFEAMRELLETIVSYEDYMLEEFAQDGVLAANQKLLDADHPFFRPIARWMKAGVTALPGYEVPASSRTGPLKATDPKIQTLFANTHLMNRKFALIRDNIDVLIALDPLDSRTASRLATSPEARAALAQRVIEPRLSAKNVELAKNAGNRAELARQLADLAWGKTSSFDDPSHVQTLIGYARKGTITREELSHWLQDDVSWICQFEEWETLKISKFKPARNSDTCEVKVTHVHLKIADVRSGTLKNITEGPDTCEARDTP